MDEPEERVVKALYAIDGVHAVGRDKDLLVILVDDPVAREDEIRKILEELEVGDHKIIRHEKGGGHG